MVALLGIILVILLGSEPLGVWSAILALPVTTVLRVIVPEVMGRSIE